MTITGSAKLFSIYTSQQAFNGQVIIKISTDGNSSSRASRTSPATTSVSARTLRDLSKIATGSATVLFLADVPDQVRLLTIYGKLKMASATTMGGEVTFDVAGGRFRRVRLTVEPAGLK